MSAGAARAPGRPRSAAADAAILRATLELLAREGYRALTMEAVRTRAGVGKATLYRRFGSKEELVRAAIVELNADFASPEDTGSLAGDFAAVVREVLVGAAVTGTLPLMPRLLSEVVDDPEMQALFSTNLVEPRRRVLREIIRRAMDRGEVRADVDPEVAVDVLVGPMIYRLIISGGRAEGLGDPAEVLRTVLDGLRPR